MKGKKIFSAALSLSLAAVLCLSGCTSAAADDSNASSGAAPSVPPAEEAVSAPAQTTVDVPTSDPLAPPEGPVYTIAQQHQPDLVRVQGTVSLDGDRILVTNSSEWAEYPEIVLGLEKDTLILNAVDGSAMTAEDLREGEYVYAYVSPAMTRSLPPIATAAVILAAIPADYGVPAYSIVEQVNVWEGRTSILMSDDVTYSMSDAELLAGPGFTCGTITLADITPGCGLLAWYDMLAESFPARAWPVKVMVIPSPYDAWAELEPGRLTVNGTEVELTEAEQPYVEGETLMVPVRAFAEALGCEVVWNADRPEKISVRGEGTEYLLTLGSDRAATGDGGDGTALTGALTARNGVSFLPADDLLNLHNVRAEGLWPV